METVALVSEYFHPSVINVYLWISLFSLSQSQSHLAQPSWVMKHASCLHGNATPTLTIYYPEALSPPSPGIYYKTIGKLSSRGHLLPLPLPPSSHIKSHAMGYNQLLSFSNYSLLTDINQATTPALLSSAISSSSIPSWSRRTCVMHLIETDPILNFVNKTWSVCWPRAGGGPLTRFSDPEKLTAGPTSETS